VLVDDCTNLRRELVEEWCRHAAMLWARVVSALVPCCPDAARVLIHDQKPSRRSAVGRCKISVIPPPPPPPLLLCSCYFMGGADNDLAVEQHQNARGLPENARDCGREGGVSGDWKLNKCDED
jgi:hypothetical protein